MTEARTVLCYGDSNTHGTMPMAGLTDMGRFGPAERWPGVLAAELGESWRVVEAGLPGRTTVYPDPISGVYKNGLAILPAELDSHAPIDLVAIMLGTNDLKTRFHVPAVEIAESVGLLVRCVLQSVSGPGLTAPRVLLIAPPPVHELGCLADIMEGAAAKSRQLASAYRGIAERFGVAFLDAGQHARSSEVDGAHLDLDGHAALGRAVAAAIN